MSVFIIAEAGVNHNGSLEMAKKLVDTAVNAGADAVKFQTFKAKNIVTKDVEQAEYQVLNTGKQETQYEMLKRLELSDEEHKVLIQYCASAGIEFMSTPFDDDGITLLKNLGMKRWKIPSGELLSIPYLRQIGKLNEPTILSTGMGNLKEVEFSVKLLLKAGLSKHNLTVLHANTAYPTPYEDVNLKAMQTLAEHLLVKVGLSDHSLGIAVPTAATALGAQVIEKHFTLDKKLPGPDHKASLEPQELKQMVAAIRQIERALGTGEKSASPSEQVNIKVVRKRILAKEPIQKGQRLTENMLMIQRANSGCFVNQWDSLIGLAVKRSYTKGEAISETELNEVVGG